MSPRRRSNRKPDQQTAPSLATTRKPQSASQTIQRRTAPAPRTHLEGLQALDDPTFLAALDQFVERLEKRDPLTTRLHFIRWEYLRRSSVYRQRWQAWNEQGRDERDERCIACEFGLLDVFPHFDRQFHARRPPFFAGNETVIAPTLAILESYRGIPFRDDLKALTALPRLKDHHAVLIVNLRATDGALTEDFLSMIKTLQISWKVPPPEEMSRHLDKMEEYLKPYDLQTFDHLSHKEIARTLWHKSTRPLSPMTRGVLVATERSTASTTTSVKLAASSSMRQRESSRAH